MLRKIIAGTAVAGALTLGFAGVAGADTPASGNTAANGARLAAVCAKLPQIESKVQDLENKANNTLIPKLETAETNAKNAGHTVLANRIADRIARIQKREARVNARLQKVEAKCATTSSGDTANS
ncbi:MAG TPA: hypothetical protein VEH82_10255 [Acidimicrobiales bacterium]|nr:hypothetical protein [Acidimicrobiales bacterium]